MQVQVPERIVSFYAATCGQGGINLGSDEKEIILLVYVILDVTTGEIIGSKQILVRPDGNFVKNRTISSSSDISSSTTSATTPASPPHGNNSLLGQPEHNDTLNGLNKFNSNITNLKGNLSNISNNNNTTTTVAQYHNSNATQALSNGGTSSTTTTTTTSMNTNSTTPTDIIEQQLPIAAAQAAGKPLIEAIEEFDSYIRSLSLNEYDIKLICDGQLPIRQCLHREACAKDITLPAIYNQFCDLRKEFLKFKSGDLSRALVPMKDVKKILQTPVAPLPQSIDEMLQSLNLSSTEDSEFYVKESRDMVTIIQHMLKSGHQFTASETVNLVLEPGICSIDDDIDGNCIVRARGLPWQSSDQDIAKFFRGLNIAKGGVALCLSPLGRRNGEALIRFISQEHRDMALKRHKHHIGPRYIEVYRATGEDFLSVAGGASNEAQAFLSKGAQVIIRMRGLPYDCSAKQVLEFFTTGENPCDVLDGTEGVLFVKKPDGRATGDAFVLFANEQDAPRALGRHRESIGQRYIELFRSTTAEVQQVLNRSMDPKTYEQNHQQPPLIAQLPTMQLSLLPQHLITSGTTKNCIRLRGLPYEALVEHILHFLDDFAKHIIYQGVHMVINAQGQPSGEAFIQMDTEESARLCAQLKHNRFMVFGKKYRYIEVFQCSGDDMNMVLNGGLQSPPIAATHPHAHHHSAAAAAAAVGKQSSLLSPAHSMLGSPFGPFNPYGAATPILTAAHHARAPHSTHPHHHHHHHHQHASPQAVAAAATAAFFQQPLVYWPYPSPPVSPTTTFYSQPSHTHPAQHQQLYSLDLLPQSYTAHHPAVSPTNYALPHSATNTNGLIFATTPNKPAATMAYFSAKQFTATLTAAAPPPPPPQASLTKIKPQQPVAAAAQAQAHFYPSYPPATVEPTPLVLATPQVANAAPAVVSPAEADKYSPGLASTTTPALATPVENDQLSVSAKKLSKLRTNAPAYKPSSVNVAASTTTTTAVNGQGLVTTNHSVELFIS